MKTSIRLSLVLAGILSLLNSGFGQGSTFFFTSSPQSVIGQGETFTASTTNGFTITAQRNINNGVSLVISSETRYWFLDFAAPGDAPIAVGRHDNATLWPYQSPSSPGLLFSGEGRSVSSLSGSFNVLAIDYGPGNTINRFDADFLQYDEGVLAQSNEGRIRFDGLNPVPEPGALSLLAAGFFLLAAMTSRRLRPR